MKKIIMISFCLILLIPIGTSYAQPQKNVCILEPIDFFMDKNLLKIITNQVGKHNVKITQINIVNELNGKTQGCDIIIHIERAINSNISWVDKTTKYLINGNSITIFTEKKAFADIYGNPALAPTNRVMTNWTCYGLAKSSFYQNIGQNTDSMTKCNPYSASPHSSNMLSPYIIQKSVDSSLKNFGL